MPPRLPPPGPGRRTGFPLVELLVVIATPAILFGPTTAAVMKFMQKGVGTRTAVEIQHQAAAVEAFKTPYRVSYLLSRTAATSPPAPYLSAYFQVGRAERIIFP